MGENLKQLEDCKRIFERHLKELNFAYQLVTQQDKVSIEYVELMSGQIHYTSSKIKTLDYTICDMKSEIIH